MTPAPTVPLEFLEFFNLPGTFLILFDRSLKVNWQIPAAEDTSDSDEVLGRVREIIIRTMESDKPPLPDARGHSVHRFQLTGGASRSGSFLLTLKNLVGDEDSVVGYLALVQEITECVTGSSPTQKPRKNESLTVEDFRTFVHKISNPLSTIFGFAQIMSFNIKENDPNREYVDEIFSNAERVREILNNDQPVRRNADRKNKITL